jgi:hypothetical protein
MNAYNERERAIENKYAHDAELHFKLQARCNRAIAFWLADHMRYTPEQAQRYAEDIIADSIHMHDKASLLDKLAHDAKIARLPFTTHALSQKMDEIFENILKNM